MSRHLECVSVKLQKCYRNTFESFFRAHKPAGIFPRNAVKKSSAHRLDAESVNPVLSMCSSSLKVVTQFRSHLVMYSGFTRELDASTQKSSA